MAVPLFIADLATLKKSLRLTGVDSAKDSEQVIADATVEARVGFYGRLGATRINTLLATPSSTAPVTGEQLDRTKAEIAEVTWVRKILMETLPILFMESSGQALQRWNEEAPFRGLKQDNKSDELAALSSKLEDLLGQLEGGEDEGRSGKVQTFSPTVVPLRTGKSVFTFTTLEELA